MRPEVYLCRKTAQPYDSQPALSVLRLPPCRMDTAVSKQADAP